MKFLTYYRNHFFSSWWLPTATYLPCLTLLVLAILPAVDLPGWIVTPLLILTALSFVCIFISFIWNCVKKRWGVGLANLGLFLLSAAVGFSAMLFVAIQGMFGPSEDGFADNLTLPEDIAYLEPLDDLDPIPGDEDDEFQHALITALLQEAGNTPRITANTDALTSLSKKNPDLLKRYLAASPAWRVFEEDGKVMATRRMKLGSEWNYDLHGYYSRSDIDRWNDHEIPDFQTRTTIGLEGKSWWKGNKQSTRLKHGETKTVNLKQGNGQPESHCEIKAGKVTLELFEQSPAPERVLTHAAIQFIDAELTPLMQSPTWATAKTNLPPNSIKTGDASFQLRNAFQPGIYTASIWVNPGEAGMLYLKAFEVTKGTQLSESRLEERSNEWVGWSNNPDEQFLSNTRFTIYEGDWGQYYAARFEVWFAPDSGGAERKLMAQTFKIQGWMR